MTDSLVVLYVASSESDATEGAVALEDAESSWSVEPAVNLPEIRDRAPVVDCVVFAETPTTAAGSHLLEVIGACQTTPLVLFTDASYGPTTARSTEGIEGYVRRSGDRAVEHLADEVTWAAAGARSTTLKALPGGNRTREGRGEENGGSSSEHRAEGEFTVDAQGRITSANEWMGAVLGVDADGLGGVPLDSLAAAGALSATDAESIVGAVSRVLGDDATEATLEATITAEERERRVTLEIDAREDEAVVDVRPTTASANGTASDAVARSNRSGNVPSSFPESRSKIARLHEMATQVVACRDEHRLFELAIEIADGVLEFDASSIMIREDREDGEWLVPKEVSEENSAGGARAMRTDEGLAGKTFRDGSTYRVGDVDSDDDASPARDSYRSGVSVPIGEYGVFQAVSEQTEAFDEEDVELAEILTAHVGETVRRIRGEERLRERRETLTRLHEGAISLVGAESESELFEMAVDAAERILEFDVCYLGIVEDDRFVPRGRSAWPIIDGYEPLPLDYGVMGETYATGESFLVEDTHDDDRPHQQNGEFRSCLSVPVGDYGVFQAISTEVDSFDEEDVELAELLTAHVVEALQRIRFEEQLHERRETVTRLHEGTVQIVAAEDERGVYDLTVDAAENVLEFDICVFLTAEDDEFVPIAHSSAMPENHVRNQPLDYGVAGETFRTGESVLIDDAREHPLVADEMDSYRSVISVPVGEYGVFQTVSERTGAFDDEDLELTELLTAHVAESVARHRAETELVSERDRLSALFDNVPDPTVRYEFVDGDAIVRDVNAAFEDVFGYDRETVLDEDVDDYILPSGYEDEAQTLNETLMAGESLQHVTRRQTADEVRDFLVNVVPLKIGERSVEGFSIYTDITDQKRRERELTAQNERLDEFASIVSHDLRNPLNVARGYLELAEETGDEEHFAEIDGAHERMGALIDQLLTLARRGETIAETEPVGVHDAARRAWSDVDTGDASLVLERDGIVEADRSRLVELVENLLRNSIEHGSDGDPLTVRVGAVENGFFVADDGVGIPESDREEVFESGYTTSDEGTGYGLRIVEQIAEAHGWTVVAAESDDGGARFEFRGMAPESTDSDGDPGPGTEIDV